MIRSAFRLMLSGCAVALALSACSTPAPRQETPAAPAAPKTPPAESRTMSTTCPIWAIAWEMAAVPWAATWALAAISRVRSWPPLG